MMNEDSVFGPGSELSDIIDRWLWLADWNKQHKVRVVSKNLIVKTKDEQHGDVWVAFIQPDSINLLSHLIKDGTNISASDPQFFNSLKKHLQSI